MAKLPEPARIDSSAEWMRLNTDPVNATKHQCKTLLDTADDFIDDFSGDYNAMIPQPERGLFTARHKALALIVQLNKRFSLGL